MDSGSAPAVANEPQSVAQTSTTTTVSTSDAQNEPKQNGTTPGPSSPGPEVFIDIEFFNVYSVSSDRGHRAWPRLRHTIQK